VGIVNPQILEVASVLCAVMALACAWRVYDRRLVAAYPAFFVYLLSQGVVIATSTLYGSGSAFYAWIFFVAYPVTWIVYCLMVRELYNHIFSSYPGIAMFGRWSIYIALVLAVAASAISRIVTRGALAHKRGGLIPLEFAGRSVVFGLAVLIILLLLVISHYPLRLHQNVVINCILFSGLLLCEAGVLLVDHLTGLRHTLNIDIAVMIFNSCCFAAWALLLSPEGKTRIIRIRRSFSASEESRLLGQLDSLNAIGLRASRK
jgi:hypothetical protein